MRMKLDLILFFFFCVYVITESSCSKKGPDIPEVETAIITAITQTSAVSGGTIKSNGGTEIIEKGVCWGTGIDPTILDSHTSDGTGGASFISTMSGLLPNTDYHVRAYSTNNAGIGYGDDKTFRTLSSGAFSQIIADHTVVDRFDDIPAYYIAEVKKMWVTYPGESHSEDIRSGMLALEELNHTYSVSSVLSGPPEPYTTANLRYSRATWGDINNATGWIYDYGEEDWFNYYDGSYHYAPDAVARTKAGISFCNSGGLKLNAIGFGWCWDYNDGINADYYLQATQAYIDYCISNNLGTKVFFTTGPDGSGGVLPPLYNYNLYLRSEQIRNYVKNDPARILFDFEDILCYNDAGQVNTETYNGHTYPVYNTSNNGGPDLIHMGTTGAIRLAKAMWWMLARMAGWDGN